MLIPRDFADILGRQVVHCVQSSGLLNASAKGYAKDQKWSRCKGHCSACAIALSRAVIKRPCVYKIHQLIYLVTIYFAVGSLVIQLSCGP